MNDELMRLAAKWRTENGDYPESKHDCADELDQALAQRAPQNGVALDCVDIANRVQAATGRGLYPETVRLVLEAAGFTEKAAAPAPDPSPDAGSREEAGDA